MGWALAHHLLHKPRLSLSWRHGALAVQKYSFPKICIWPKMCYLYYRVANLLPRSLKIKKSFSFVAIRVIRG